MTRAIISIVFLSWLCIAETCLSQGEAALPFLLISPLTEANGMGEAAVANHTDDPLAVIYNPAHLGMTSLSTHFSFGHNFAYWLPSFYDLDLSIRTYGFGAGLNLGTVLRDFPQIGLGVAYSRIYLNYGTFNVTSPSGPEVIGTFDSYESSDQYTIGIGIHSIVRASVGMTIKHVVSKLSAPGEAKATLYDYGLLLDVPAIDILSKLSGSPITCTPNIAPYADWSIGVSKNNLGQESISYVDQSQADPLPRYARAGMGFDLGMIYSRDDLNLKLLSFKWTIEANDLLVNGRGTSAGYQSGLGDIKFFDEVILGHANKETKKAKGWELYFLEILAIRGGRFEEDPLRGDRNFTTSGWSLHSAGLIKLVWALAMPVDEKDIAGYILTHLDMQYSEANLTTYSSDSPLKGTHFSAFNIRFIL